METKKIKEALASIDKAYINAEEITGDKRFDYVMPTMQKLYSEIQPNQVTLKNQIIYLNSNQQVNDNAFMFQCQDLYRNASPTHTGCLNLRVDMCVGNGLIPVIADPATQEFLDHINRVGDSWQQVWDKVNFDMQLHGMFAIQCLYAKTGEIVECLHTDISTVRAVSPVENEDYVPYINTWAISNRWADIATKNRYTPSQNAAMIKNFMPATWAEDGARQLLVHRDYQSGNFPYGLPHYNSVLSYVRLDQQLSLYHLNKVSGGFFPNVIVQLVGSPTQEEKDVFVNKFMRKYMGADKEKILFLWSETDDAGQKPLIIPFSTNDDNQIFEILDKITTQKLLTAHQVQPELASLPSVGQSLGGDSNKLIAATDVMLRNVVTPIQKSMLQSINKIFRHNQLQDVSVSNDVVVSATNNSITPTN